MFTVLDQTEKRQDLAQRREVKYVLTGADVGTVRTLLDTNTRRQIHHHEVSVVRSVYFDDARLSACQANLNGLGRRRKLRLRWYDQLLPGRDAFLEIKWRDNKVTGKHRMHVTCEQSLSELAYKHWTAALTESVPERYLPYLLAYSDPIVIVEYRREHFISPDGQLRLTIDYDLAFYDQTGKQFLSTRFPQRLNDFMVLEGKTPVGRESELKQLLYPLALRAARCSKYVHGCQTLGLVAGRH
ncbi:MAG: VTC domain-containing protein [Pirellulaceae bacterium]|nr:VTC domain-containing protein [Pirellulaceae bacterium]